MKLYKLSLVFILLIAVVSCKDNPKDTEAEPATQDTEQTQSKAAETPKEVSFLLASKSESNASGMVNFTETNGVVTMTAKLTGLDEGTHAIHIHEKADCSSNDGKSSGGHWNPTFESHGAWGAEAGYHKGDIGNFQADKGGNGVVNFSTDQWCIGCDDPNKNILGKAIIVHQGEDDLTSQPSGAAGARVSCGGIIQ